MVSLDFEIHLNEQDKDAVTIRQFHGEMAAYETLTTSEDSKDNLTKLVVLEHNPNVQFYGAPGNVDKKISIWGARGEQEQFTRCFFAKTTSDGDLAGFVNIGLSTIKLDGKAINEGGALFHSDYNSEPLVTNALNDVYINYPATVGSQYFGPAFVYTISAENPLASNFFASGLKALSVEGDSKENQCMLQAFKNNDKRFSVTEDGKFLESGNEKLVFYHFYQDVNTIEECAALGEVEVRSDEF